MPRLLLAVLLAAACGNKATPQNPVQQRQVTLFVTTELQGMIEPCGCTSDPHGDLARTVALIDAARADRHRAVLVIDGGSLLYTKPSLPDYLHAQEALKADLIVKAFGDQLQVAAVGLGPYDLADGPGAVKPPRQVANLAAGSGIAIEPPKVIDAGGIKVGVFGVVAPDALASLGIKATDPIAAARKAVADLRGQGAEVVIALAHMVRQDAQKLAREVEGIDFVAIGQNAPEPQRAMQAPVRVGEAWLVQPANRGQVVTRLDLTVRTPGPFADAIGEARAETMIAHLDESIPSLESELAAWKNDPTADAAFVADKKKELAEMKAQREQLGRSPLAVPDKGSWFVMQQVAIKKRLPCNEAVVAAKIAYDKASGEANVAEAKGQKPPPAPAGQSSYVGTAECENCHDDAATFWATTKHAGAWETLERVGRQYNFDCTGCHATGWDQPGGSNLAYNEPLRDVQCETCHGPGSRHVDANGKDKTMTRSPASDLCLKCHSELHSDTFDFEPYLRDITGKGHGDAFRAKLGDGPTGHSLRQAALDKAGKEIGAGCPK